jgi:hypothetical protein
MFGLLNHSLEQYNVMGFYRGPHVVTDGLVLWLDAANPRSYPGSGTVWNDMSGNNNTGTLTNGPTFSSASLGSIVFDGTNDWIDNGLSSSLKPANMSVNCWIKGGPGPNLGIFVDGDSNSANRGYLMYYNTNNTIAFQSRFNTTTVGAATTISTANTNQICNVTGTYDGATVKIYFNGILEATTNYTQGSTYGAGRIYLGFYRSYQILGGANADTYSFRGSIYNTQIYNRALSPQEVKQNYDALKGRYNLI